MSVFLVLCLRFVGAALMLVVFSVQADDVPVLDRAASVKERLVALNELGGRCYSELSVRGYEGALKDSCVRFLEGSSGKYMAAVQGDCEVLLNVYNAHRKRVIDDLEIVTREPSVAGVIRAEMQAIKSSCFVEALNGYKNFKRVPAKINALAELSGK